MLLATPNDTKALFRRSQALKELGRLEESLLEARKLITIDPKNKDGIELIQSLTRLVQDRKNEQQSTKSQVKKMLEVADKDKGENKKNVISIIRFPRYCSFLGTNRSMIEMVKALNNLIVLSREEAGCDEIIASGGISELLDLLKKEAGDKFTVLTISRILASLCKNSFKRVRFCSNLWSWSVGYIVIVVV